MPKSFARAYIKNYDINSAEISKDKLENYSCLKLIVNSYSKKGEIVNSGGINLKYIDKNCKSKLIDNLWFCGEVLDIDGFCGGFNLQNCWSSANAVANNVTSLIINEKV